MPDNLNTFMGLWIISLITHDMKKNWGKERQAKEEFDPEPVPSSKTGHNLDGCGLIECNPDERDLDDLMVNQQKAQIRSDYRRSLGRESTRRLK